MGAERISSGFRPTRLASETATTVQAAIYTVDSGYRSEVVDAEICNNDGAPHLVTLTMAGKSVLNGVLGANCTVQWDGFVVLYEGEVIELQADANGVVDVTVSGASGPVS